MNLSFSTAIALAFAILLLVAPQTALSEESSSKAGSFAERCDNLTRRAVIQIEFEDRYVKRDDTLGMDDLKALSPASVNRYHNILGLTHASPTAAFEFTPVILVDTDGRSCAVPSVKIKLGFSELKVYLARELGGACRRSAVWEHEQEHVSVWRNHLRAGAQLLRPMLQKSLARPYYFSSREDADTALRPQVEAQVAALLQRLRAGINAAQGEIDSPRSYAFVANLMRRCP